jgi:hypothetical protein
LDLVIASSTKVAVIRPSSVVTTLAGAACYLTLTRLRLCTSSVNWCYMSPRKVGNQIRIVSYYSPEAIARLTKLSEVTRVRQAEYLREALDDLLRKKDYTAVLRKAAK